MIPIGVCLGTFGVSYANLHDAALTIERADLDSVWVWDHYRSWENPRQSVLEGPTALAGLAQATERIGLGTLVANNNNRHPARLAKIAATLQEMAGGRFTLGIGGGGWAPEQEMLAIEQGDVAARTGKLAEALTIIPQLWRGEPVSFAGTHYQLRDAVVAPAPMPRPPIIVGARGPALCRLAGECADGLNLQWRGGEKLPELLAALDDGLRASGRSRAGFDLSVHAGLPDLGERGADQIAAWEGLGFTRAIIYLAPPYDLGGLGAAIGHQGLER